MSKPNVKAIPMTFLQRLTLTKPRYHIIRFLFLQVMTLTCIPYFLAAGGFEMRISPETGFFGQTLEKDQRRYLTNLASVNMGYTHTLKNQWLKFNLKFRPEFYSSRRTVSILHIAGQSTYYRTGERFDAEASLQRKRQNYYETYMAFYTDITQASLRVYLKLSPSWALDIQPVYMRRILTGAQEHRLNTGMASLLLSFHKKSTFSFNAGLFAEQYQISLPYRTETPKSNNGRAAGPLLQISYQGAWITQWSYGMLKRTSSPANENSVEHRITGIWGKPLSDKWSAFFFMEYSYRNYKDPASRNNDLYYSLTNNENRIYAKISYEWKKKSEWFLKAGYLEYELYRSSARFAGVQLTSGFDFKF